MKLVLTNARTMESVILYFLTFYKNNNIVLLFNQICIYLLLCTFCKKQKM